MAYNNKDKYEDALEKARVFYENCKRFNIDDTANMLETIFPALKGPDEEQIRKDIMHIVNEWWDKLGGSVTPEFSSRSEMVEWLEKHKPSVWHREDEQNLNACLAYINDVALHKWLTDAIHVRYDEPQKWSDKDDTQLTNIIIMLKEGASLHFKKDDIAKGVNWLKSIKPQAKFQWKPDSDQLDALHDMIASYEVHSCDLNKEKISELVESLAVELHLFQCPRNSDLVLHDRLKELK